MKTKLALGSALVVSFLIGAIFVGVAGPRISRALTPPSTSNDAMPAATTPQPRHAAAYPYQRPSAYLSNGVRQSEVVYRDAPVVRHHRSRDREILIVAGSAGAGTAIGALAGGGKGAGIGALSGGVAGLTYDLLTRNK